MDSFGGARVGEADAEIVRRKGANQALGAVHAGSLGKGRQLITRGLCARRRPNAAQVSLACGSVGQQNGVPALYTSL